MFLEEKLKSIKLTKPINILLHNDKKLSYTGYFLVIHGASSSRSLSRRSLWILPTAAAIYLLINGFVTLSNDKQSPLEAHDSICCIKMFNFDLLCGEYIIL